MKVEQIVFLFNFNTSRGCLMCCRRRRKKKKTDASHRALSPHVASGVAVSSPFGSKSHQITDRHPILTYLKFTTARHEMLHPFNSSSSSASTTAAHVISSQHPTPHNGSRPHCSVTTTSRSELSQHVSHGKCKSSISPKTSPSMCASVY